MKTFIPKLLVLIILTKSTIQSNHNAIRFMPKKEIKENREIEFYQFALYTPDYNSSELKNQDTYLNPDNSPNYDKMAIAAECKFPNEFQNSKNKNFQFNLFFFGGSTHMRKIEREEIKNEDDNFLIFSNPNSLSSKKFICVPYMYENENFIVIDFLLVLIKKTSADLQILYLETFVKDNKFTFCKYKLDKHLKKKFDFTNKENCVLENIELSDDQNYPPFLEFQVFEKNLKENFKFQSYFEENGKMNNFFKFMILPKNEHLRSIKKINEFNFINIVYAFENPRQDPEKVDKTFLNIHSEYENENLLISIENPIEDVEDDLDLKTKCKFEEDEILEIQNYLKDSENTDINYLLISGNDNSEIIKFNEFEKLFEGLNTKNYQKFNLDSYLVLQSFQDDKIKCQIKTNLKNLKNEIDDHLILDVSILIKKNQNKFESFLNMIFTNENFSANILYKDFFDKKMECIIHNLDEYKLMDKEKSSSVFLNIFGKDLKIADKFKNVIEREFTSQLILLNYKENTSCSFFVEQKGKKTYFYLKIENKKKKDHFSKLVFKKKEKEFHIINLEKNQNFICKISENFGYEKFLDKEKFLNESKFLEQRKVILKTYFQNADETNNSMGYWINYDNQTGNEYYLNIGFNDEIIQKNINKINNIGCYIYFFDENRMILNVYENEENLLKFKFYKNTDNKKAIGNENEMVKKEENENIFKMEILNNQEIIYIDENIKLQINDDFSDANVLTPNLKFHKRIDLFIMNNDIENLLSFYLIKIDDNMFIYDIFDEELRTNKVYSKIKNFFIGNDFFSSSILKEDIFKLSFFKGYEKYDHEKDDLFILERIEQEKKFDYYLTKVNNKKTETEKIGELELFGRYDRYNIYLHSKNLEKQQKQNKSEIHDKKILSLTQTRGEKPNFEFEQINILDTKISLINLQYINKRILFICIYREGSTIKMLIKDKNNKKESLLTYQNYTDGFFLLREKKDLSMEENLKFTFNLQLKHACSCKEKKIVSLEIDLNEFKCIFLSFDGVGKDSLILNKGDLEVDKEKMIIGVILYEKEQKLIV